MDNERSSFINIGGEEYELILTTRATKEIAARYGGLENLGDKLLKNKNFEMALGEIVWLITLLANQSILIHNLKNRDEKKPLLTEEDVELLTVPSDLAEYKAAIRVRNAILRARKTQKTRRPGKRRRAVYPAPLLRHRPAPSDTG